MFPMQTLLRMRHLQLLAERCHFASDDDVVKQSVLLQCHERNAEHMSETPLKVPSRFWVLL